MGCGAARAVGRLHFRIGAGQRLSLEIVWRKPGKETFNRTKIAENSPSLESRPFFATSALFAVIPFWP
jgi:hypothetical protein